MLDLLALTLLGSSSCQPDLGEFISPHHEYVLLGELHGTNEIPKYFESVVRRALRSRGRVVAAIELPATLNEPLDAFVASDMRDAEREDFLDAVETYSSSDGRTSRAMIDVILRLAKLSKENQDFSLRFVAPDLGNDDKGTFSSRFARNVTALSGDTLVIALVGNIHAAESSIISTSEGLPLGGLLPAGSTLNVLVRTPGGEAWNCVGSNECGVVSSPIEEIDCGAGKVDETLAKWFDIYVDLDSKTSASRPYFPVDKD